MKIALSGIGRIALDQHVPALAASSDWTLSATISRSGQVPDVPAFADLDGFFAACPDVRTISLCQPPLPRYDYARAALAAGRHVMLEKPPGATVSEVHELLCLASDRNVTLYAGWRSREAGMVDHARNWLAGKRIVRARVDWREDVREWHDGQDWLFLPGGLGVLDPGMNALSILTTLLPDPLHLEEARFDIPCNRQAPIAADLRFAGDITARFDWLWSGPPIWEISVETEDGSLLLSDGGEVLSINGAPVNTETGAGGAYSRLYAHFADLIARGDSEVDLSPMLHVTDAFTLGERRIVAPFEF